jgi:NagD protein
MAADATVLLRPQKLYAGYVFDLDGTVYLGDDVLPTAPETIAALRGHGRRVVFFSNNATKTRREYAAKLTRLGIPASEDDVLLSTSVLLELLRATAPGARVFPIGEAPLQAALRDAGFPLEDHPARIDVVVASFDRAFAYPKLQTAFDAIRAGARLVATNADRYCPVPGGGEPDAAAVIAAIEACTGVPCEAVAGKPSRHAADAVLRMLGVPASECLVAGDRLETDIALGLDAGMSAALTLTGATAVETLDSSPVRPTYVIESLADLLPGSAG